MKRALIAVAFVVSTAAAACGSSNTSSSGGGANGPAGSSDTAGGSLPLGGGGNFCDIIKSFTAQSKAIGNAFSDPSKAKPYFQALLVATGQLVDAAPDELKSDARLDQTAFIELVGALDKVNYDFSKLPPAETQMLSRPDITAANKHIEAYIASACGITPGVAPGATP